MSLHVRCDVWHIRCCCRCCCFSSCVGWSFLSVVWLIMVVIDVDVVFVINDFVVVVVVAYL